MIQVLLEPVGDRHETNPGTVRKIPCILRSADSNVYKYVEVKIDSLKKMRAEKKSN